MPSGKGYWVSPKGEVVEIFVHRMAVKGDPERFGLSREEFESMGGDRVKILTAVMKNGWVRVRVEPHRRVIECYRIDDGSRMVIKSFLEKTGVLPGWPKEHWNLSVLEDGKSVLCSAEELLSK